MNPESLGNDRISFLFLCDSSCIASSVQTSLVTHQIDIMHEKNDFSLELKLLIFFLSRSLVYTSYYIHLYIGMLIHIISAA